MMPKKEIDNLKVLAEYEKSVLKIARSLKKVICIIDNEMQRLASLKKKFILNEHNEKLLDSRNAHLVKFKEELIEVSNRGLNDDLLIDHI